MTKTDHQKLIQDLVSLGLDTKEALVYTAGLSLGPTTIANLAFVTEIKRTSIYPIIKRLSKAGLFSETIGGFKTLYTAEPPQNLTKLLEEKKRRFESVLPNFQELFNLKGVDDSIKRFEGIQGIKSLYDMILNETGHHDPYYIITDQSKWLSLDPNFFKNFIERRSQKRLHVKALMLNNEAGQYAKKYEQNFGMEVKLLPETINRLDTNVVITDKYLLIHQTVPPISAILIENKSTILFQKQMFELLWQSN